MERFFEMPAQENSEALLRKKFEEQFHNFEEIKLGEGKFEAIDLTPEEIKDETPVLLVPGYGKTPRSYKEALFEIYKSGRRVLSLTAPTTLTGIEATEKYTVGQYERAHALLELLNTKGLENVDAVTHSEGGINATIAAEVAPEKFRHFVFVAIPGVTDTSSLFEIGKRAYLNMREMKQDLKISQGEMRTRYEQSIADITAWMSARAKAKNIWTGGHIRAFLESAEPGEIIIAEEVRRLHTSGHGISIIAGVEDKMLPMNEYQRNKEGEKRSAEELGIDGFYSVKKGHAELEVNEDMGALVVHALGALKQKYDKINSLANPE